MGVCQTVYHYSNIDSNSDHTGEESEEEFLNFDIDSVVKYDVSTLNFEHPFMLVSLWMLKGIYILKAPTSGFTYWKRLLMVLHIESAY